MIQSKEIHQKAIKKYPSFLVHKLEGKLFENIIITGNKKVGEHFRQEIENLVKGSKEIKGYGYEIEYKQVKTKMYGLQDLPQSILFSSEKDFLKFIGKEREATEYIDDARLLYENFDELWEWIITIKSANKIVDNHTLWGDIIKVLRYFKAHPQPQLYRRELPIKVHTKFIEGNEGIIKELLNIIIAPFINEEETNFEKRFHLKYSESLVRFKVLDQQIADQYFHGVNDLSIPISQFLKLNLPLKTAYIFENKKNIETAITLPHQEQSIAIFGSGYKVGQLKEVAWLHNVAINYWGDIDVQGFEILSQVRGYFPQVKSIFMDQITFDEFFEGDKGTVSKVEELYHLTASEKQLYTYVSTNNLRLEQEKIPQEYVNNVLL